MNLPPGIRPLLTAAALALLLASCRYEEVDGVGTRTADDTHPPQLDVAFGECTRGPLDQWHATATVVNHTEVPMTYELTVGFYDGDIRLAQRSHWVRDLRPAEQAEIDRGWWIENDDRVNGCRLLTVDRFG